LGRRAAFERIGPFDEGYQLGIGEDEDFFRRAAALGLASGITGSAFVHHFGSASLGALRRERGRGFEEKNLARLRSRWGAPRRAGALDRLAKAGRRVWERLRWAHALKE
jgi:GT2 family glycosyltransferase